MASNPQRFRPQVFAEGIRSDQNRAVAVAV
jgi:hypothetical protein